MTHSVRCGYVRSTVIRYSSIQPHSKRCVDTDRSMLQVSPVGRRPAEQRPQALRGVELEHPTLTLLPDVERAEVAQRDALAALERRIDLLERGIDDLLYEGGISAGPVRDQGHQCRLLNTLRHCAVLEGCDVLVA